MMDPMLQQDEQSLIQAPIPKVSQNSPLRLSKDAPEVIPVEYYGDNQQDPQAIPVKEQKEVIPLEEDTCEPGLRIRMGREEKERRASSGLASGLHLDDRYKANISAPLQRFSLRSIAIVIFVVVVIIVVTVVPTTLLKHSKGDSSPSR